jgi:hypothetical protein
MNLTILCIQLDHTNKKTYLHNGCWLVHTSFGKLRGNFEGTNSPVLVITTKRLSLMVAPTPCFSLC